MASDSEQDRDARVDRLVAQIVRLRESGDEVLVTELLAQHPDLADSVEGFLKDQAFLEQAAKGASSDTDANEAQQTEIKQVAEAEIAVSNPQSDNTESAKQASLPPEPETTYVMAFPAEIAAGVKPFGRYRIENLLGEGAMGAVYLAHDTQLDRKVALKTPKFNSDNAVRLSKRFRREAQSAATLHHRNICPVYDVGQIDGIDYLTMAYIEGKPLSAYVNPDKPLAQRQIALVIRKLALALQAAHDAGVVHRDLKPSNVIIDREGEPVVMDFGLAGRVDNTGSSRLTKSGTILGTPAYMAPEQIEGRQKLLGPPSDVYSLGVVMYELLSGRLPFRGSPASVMGKVLVAKPPSLKDVRPDIDPDLAGICEAMMVKHPGKRTASMVKVAETLTAWIRASRQAEQPPQATSSKVAPPPLPAIVTTGEEMAALSKQAASSWKVDSKEISDVRRTNEVKPIGWWLKTKAWFDSLPPRNRWWIAAAGAAVPLLLLLGVTFIIKINIDDDGNVTTEVTREPTALAAGPNETTSSEPTTSDIASSNAASSEPINGSMRPAASAVGSPEQSQPQRFLGATNARRLDVINRAAGVERGGIERLWVSSDGLEIYWQQTDWNSWKRGHQSKGGIWYARRVSHSAQWSDFRRVCTQEGMNPSVTDDGLYMICTKHPGTDTIYEASRSSKSESFSIPKPIRELRPGALVREAAIKADGRWMAYAEGWMGQTKLFLSHRNSPTASWEPAKENKLNRDSKFDIGFNFPRITDDALTLWFHFGIGWPFQYVASGVKPDLSKPYDDFKYVRLNGRPLLGASAFVLPEQRQIIYTAPTKDIEDAFWEVWTADLQNDPTARTTLSSLAGKTFHIEFLSGNEGQDRAWWGNYSFTSAGEIKRDNQTVGSWREVIGHQWLGGEDGFELEFTSPSRRKSYATWITENRIVGGVGAIISGRLVK